MWISPKNMFTETQNDDWISIGYCDPTKLTYKIDHHTKTTFKFKFEFPSSWGKKGGHVFYSFLFFKKNHFLMEIISPYTLIYKYVATFTSSQFD